MSVSQTPAFTSMLFQLWRSSRVQRSLIVALASTFCCFAQTGVTLTLSSASGSPGSVVTLSLSLNGTGNQPADLEWTLIYSPTDFSSVSVGAASIAIAANKSVSCNNSVPGVSNCVLWGLNATPISNGVVASVSLTLSSSTLNTSSAVQFSTTGAADGAGASLPALGNGTVVTIQQQPSLNGFTCAPVSVTPPGASNCRVALTAPALSPGATVTLSSSSSAASVPPTVTILPGATSSTFNATAGSVAVATPVTLAASYLGISETFGLVINPTSSIRVNAGGPAYTDPQGQVWSADMGFTGGTTYSTASSIANTTTPALYQSERYGNMQFQFAVPNGNYAVTLKFAEIYYGSPGQRVFNVSMNGTAVLTNFDIVAQAGGGFIALDRTFPVSVTSGQITIQFTNVIDNAKISAIQILPGAGISVGVTPATATLSASQTQQFTATVSGTTNPAVGWSINPNVGTVSPTGLYTAPSTITAIQNVTVTATSAADPTQSASATVTLQPSSGSFTTIRVNAGGSAYTDPQGQVWSADMGFTGGTTYSTASSIANTTTPVLYQSERYGNMQYQFAVPNGNYAVTLKFAEIYYGSTGQRVFNVSMNGTAVLTNFDIVAQAGGGFIALDRTFPVSVTNGQIAIQFTNIIDNAKISAIQIATAGPAFTPVRVNAGGAGYTDPQGQVWAADFGFNGGFTYSTTSSISNSTTPVLYQTERWNSTPLQYQFPVPNGNYSVNLKFAEIYFTQTGQRVFNAAINGTSVLTNFDVVASAGGPNLAVDKAFPVTVTNGQITILLTPVVQNPAINAIEITAQ
jgi:hypothetical protein